MIVLRDMMSGLKLEITKQNNIEINYTVRSCYNTLEKLTEMKLVIMKLYFTMNDMCES